MRRRDFLKVVAGSTTAWSFGAYAQQSALPVLGVLHGVAATQWADRMTATKTIQIVFTTASNPVRAGLYSSFRRPAGNLAGITVMTSSQLVNQLQLLM